MLESLVEEEVHVVLLIVDKSEWRHRARTQAEPLHHTLRRGKRQLALAQDVFKVVYCHRLLRVEDNQIVTVALVVAEEEVLAVLRSILSPIFSCYLNGWSFGVLVPRILNVVLVEPTKNFITSFHSANIGKKEESCCRSRIKFLTLYG